MSNLIEHTLQRIWQALIPHTIPNRIAVPGRISQLAGDTPATTKKNGAETTESANINRVMRCIMEAKRSNRGLRIRGGGLDWRYNDGIDDMMLSKKGSEAESTVSLDRTHHRAARLRNKLVGQEQQPTAPLPGS